MCPQPKNGRSTVGLVETIQLLDAGVKKIKSKGKQESNGLYVIEITRRLQKTCGADHRKTLLIAVNSGFPRQQRVNYGPC